MRQTTHSIGSSGRPGDGCGCLLQLFLLFTAVPLAELWLLLLLSRRVGLPPTLGLVIFTGALGAWLARSQGLRALDAVQTELASGRMPTTSLLDGMLILVAGTVLLTPGLLTDIFGFVLLVPVTRGWIRRGLSDYLRRRFVPTGAGFTRSRTSYRDDDERVILVDETGEQTTQEPDPQTRH